MTKVNKILVFGAGGRIGRLVVDYAYNKGYEVIGFYRHSENPDPRAEVITGNATTKVDVEQAVAKCDAIISCLGHIKNGDPNMQTKAIKLICDAMAKNNVRRIVSLTGTGARQYGDRPSLIDAVTNYALAAIDKDRVRDGQMHIKALEQTNLDWTVVRILKYAGVKPVKTKLTSGGPARILTSRQQVAETLVDQIESKDWIKKAPIISW